MPSKSPVGRSATTTPKKSPSSSSASKTASRTTASPQQKKVDQAAEFHAEGFEGAQKLLDFLGSRKDAINSIKILRLTLNASQYDDFTDDLFSIALDKFHPLPDEQDKMAHSLKQVNITITGKIVFSRFTSVITSPCASRDAPPKLQALLNSNLSNQKFAEILSDTPVEWHHATKLIVQALTKIRGVDTVSIKGSMEEDLKREIITSMTTAPGSSPRILTTPSPTPTASSSSSSAPSKKRKHDTAPSTTPPSNPTTNKRRRKATSSSPQSSSSTLPVSRPTRILARPQTLSEFGAVSPADAAVPTKNIIQKRGFAAQERERKAREREERRKSDGADASPGREKAELGKLPGGIMSMGWFDRTEGVGGKPGVWKEEWVLPSGMGARVVVAGRVG